MFAHIPNISYCVNSPQNRQEDFRLEFKFELDFYVCLCWQIFNSGLNAIVHERIEIENKQTNNSWNNNTHIALSIF